MVRQVTPFWHECQSELPKGYLGKKCTWCSSVINRERLVLSVNVLRHVIDDSLGLRRETHKVSGFELSEQLLDAVAYNTYVETVGNKADTLYLRIKEASTEMTMYSYLDQIRRLSEKLGWKDKSVVLAFDTTDENFYGDVQGIDIHGWTKRTRCDWKV